MVFGKRSGCARLGAPELWWGACRLPTADTVKYLGLRLESEGGWAAQQAAGAVNGWAALYQWPPVLRSQHLSAATKLLVLRSRIAPRMTYGMELWRPAKNGANMTAVLTRAADLISGIHREASHTAVQDRSVNQDVMLADLDIWSAADHCRMAHARQYAREATSAAAAANYVHNDRCSPEFSVELSAASAPDYMGAAVWHGLHTRDTWCMYARTCHETALSHGVRFTSAPTRAAQDMVGEVANTTRKVIRIGISASALVCRGLRQPSDGLQGRPRAPAHHTQARWVADICNPSARERLWSAAVRSAYTTASSAVVPPIMSLRCRTWPEIIFLTLGTQLLPRRVVSATITSSPHARSSVLLLGLKRLGNTDGATLSIYCLNASVSLAWTALSHLPFSGMTSCGCVLDQTTQRWCC